jgi:hypothetical protein
MPFIGRAGEMLLREIANGRLLARLSSIGRPVRGLTVPVMLDVDAFGAGGLGVGTYGVSGAPSPFTYPM